MLTATFPLEATEAGDFSPDGLEGRKKKKKRGEKKLCNHLERRYDCAEMRDQ